jgi:hypothetical protein
MFQSPPAINRFALHLLPLAAAVLLGRTGELCESYYHQLLDVSNQEFSRTFLSKPSTPLASGVNPAAAGKGKHKEATTSSGGNKGKDKMVGNHNRPDEEIDSDSDLDNFDKESEPKVKPKPCVRPRKDILKDGAKRMKKASLPIFAGQC